MRILTHPHLYWNQFPIFTFSKLYPIRLSWMAAPMRNITLQAWSVVQASWVKGSFLDNPEFPELNAALERIAEKYGINLAF